jgi:peptide/nickel transport system permease protein
MKSYVLNRVLSGLVVMAVVATIVFIIIRVIPGDPASIMLGPDATLADVNELKEKMGLDKPIFVQYYSFLTSIATGDLGRSIFLDKSVLSALADRAEPTIFLSLMSVAIAVLIGIPAGVISAVNRNTILDKCVMTFAMLASSLPSFWLGLMFMQIFAVDLRIFPISGYGSTGDSLATRLSYLLLPSVVLGLTSSALITRFTRGNMLDILGEDYIRTAKAKGVPNLIVIMKHAFRNAFIPILTVIGMCMALLLGGAVVTETVFNLPGVGNLIVSAVMRRDYPVIQGALIVVAGVYVLINLLIDLLYVVVDPRVKY